jgi:uncharacterized membrane protein YfhO
LLVVAQTWDPGWTAHVDGEPTSVYRVDGARIGVPLAAGVHTIALRHHAPGLRAGALSAAVAALMLALRVGWRQS